MSSVSKEEQRKRKKRLRRLIAERIYKIAAVLFVLTLTAVAIGIS